LSQQVYELPAGMGEPAAVYAEHAQRQLRRLQQVAPNFSDDHILARLVKGPLDYEHTNPHMVHGAFHGGDRGIAHNGPLRPVPGWAGHRMPIPGLYQTGGSTHPGGSITGGPGRNAARVVLSDLGHEFEAVVGGQSAVPVPRG
jgi:phytoene dehydrogenase-like protein